jgi:valyl-tRNA synthetase
MKDSRRNRRNATKVIDDLTYASYRHQRTISPHITPEQWVTIFPTSALMEARWQEEVAKRKAQHASEIEEVRRAVAGIGGGYYDNEDHISS